MAIQISENDVTVKYVENVGKGQLAAECNISCQNGVSKIYCVSGGCNVKSVTALDRAVNVACEVTTRVIYADVSGAVDSADYVTEITETVAAEGALADMPVSCRCSISDIRSETVGSAIKVQSVVDLIFEGESEYTASLVSEVQGALTRTQESELINLKGGGTDSFTESEEFESGGKISKILSYGAEVLLSSVRAEEGSVYAEGEVWMQLVYDDGGICSKQFSHPFAQQLMIGGAKADDIVTASAGVKAVSILLTGSEDEGVAVMDVTVGVDVRLFETVAVETVTDVFSPAAELEVTSMSKTFTVPEGMKFVNKRICGNADVEVEGMRRISAGVPSYAVLSNLYADGGKLTAEGVISVCEIYETDGGETGSVGVDIPFSFTCDIKDEDIRCTGVTVTDIVSRVRREGEIEVCANVALQLVSCSVKELKGVTHIEVGQERETDLGGISVYTVGGDETLWDVAKALNMSERDIIEQNEFAGKGIKEGDRIVVFRCVS